MSASEPAFKLRVRPKPAPAPRPEPALVVVQNVRVEVIATFETSLSLSVEDIARALHEAVVHLRDSGGTTKACISSPTFSFTY